MAILAGDDVLIGPGADLDKSEAAIKRTATLAAMGIGPLTPYGSVAMNTAHPVKKSRYGNRFTPRKDARAAGELYYFSPRPCLRGHTSERFTSTACCVACQDIYRTANIDQVRKHSRESHQRKRDRAKAEL